MESGDDYYAFPKYAVNNADDEVYASDRNGNEYYLKTGDQEICARDRKGVLFYAKNSKGDFLLPTLGKKPYYLFKGNYPIYPMRADGQNVYAKHKGSDIYPNGCLYLKDSEGNEVYARSSRGLPYYASRLEMDRLVQFYAQDKNNQNIVIYNEDGGILYPLDLTADKPIYRVVNHVEIYENSKNGQVYGRTRKGLPVYAKNNKDEYLASDKNQMNYYANYKDTQFYPKLQNKDQFYLNKNGIEIYAVASKDKQYYAKNINLDDKLATIDGSKTYYCKEMETEKYPEKANKDQFYKVEDSKQIMATDSTGLNFYARKNDSFQFYPIDFTTLSSDDE